MKLKRNPQTDQAKGSKASISYFFDFEFYLLWLSLLFRQVRKRND